jgi:hypothetical protein
MTSGHTTAMMTLDTIIELVIPLITLLLSSPVMWHEEYL